MLRTPRIVYEPYRYYGWQAYLNGDYASPFTAPPVATYSGGYNSSEEYLDDVADRKPYVGMKECRHLKITRKARTPTVGRLFAWYGGDHSASGWKWVFLDPPATRSFWNGGFQGAWPIQNSAGYFPVETYGVYEQPTKGCPTLGYVDGNRLKITTPSDIEDLISRAMSSMAPGIRPAGNVSLLNSIYELKDMKSLPATFRKINSGLDSLEKLKRMILPNSQSRLYQKGLKKPLRSILHMGSDGYLQTQFNILPLLSDIASVRTAVADARKQLRQLLDGANRPQKRHYALPLLNTFTDIPFSQISAPDPITGEGNFIASRTVSYGVRLFHATLEYCYGLPDWVGEDSILQAFLDRVGINLNPAIIWNALPWSFVVDWIFGVSRWLDNFKHRNIEPIVSIRGFCWSTTVSRLTTTTYGRNSADSCVELNEVAYQRVPLDNPALYSSLISSGLSPKEFSLAAALAIARV